MVDGGYPRVTHLLQELLEEGTNVYLVGVGQGAVDVEQYDLQWRQLCQGVAASDTE
jgi:hypothetical protein